MKFSDICTVDSGRSEIASIFRIEFESCCKLLLEFNHLDNTKSSVMKSDV